MENLSGLQLGPYQVLEPLGEGGMAVIYKGYQPSMERYVALKVLARKLATSPEFIGRFKQEAKVLANLQHPCIVPVFDYGAAEGYTYIVMPYIESGTLTERMHGGKPFPVGQIMQAITQVGDALDYAHSFGLVHRDIKPSNILIDKRGNCLLTDFGIAKLYESGSGFTSTGTMVGTPAYMSPEQGRGAAIDHRSDIYSLGIVLYEMATGRVPYTAETPVAIVFKHIQDPLPLPRHLNSELPEVLERVVLKALAKSPDDRYQTARDFVKAIQVAGQELGALPEPLSLKDAVVEVSSGKAELFRAKSNTGATNAVATPAPGELGTVVAPSQAKALPVAVTPPPAARPPLPPPPPPKTPPPAAQVPSPLPANVPPPPKPAPEPLANMGAARPPAKKFPVGLVALAGGLMLLVGIAICGLGAMSMAAKPATPTATETVKPTQTAVPPTATSTSLPKVTATPSNTPLPTPTLTPAPIGQVQTGAEIADVWVGDTLQAQSAMAALWLPVTSDLPFETFLQPGSQIRLEAVTEARVSFSLLPTSDIFVQTGLYAEGSELLFLDIPLVMYGQGCWAAHYDPINVLPLTISCYQGSCSYRLNDDDARPLKVGTQLTLKNLTNFTAVERAIPSAETRAYIEMLRNQPRGAQTLVTCGLVAAPTSTRTPRATTNASGVTNTPRPTVAGGQPTNTPRPTANNGGATATVVPPTAAPPTAVPPTSVPPTSVPPTNPPPPPTDTPVPLPPTNTPVPLPPTNTPVPLPPTNTSIPNP